MKKQLTSAPIEFFIMILLDITGIFLIEANNSGLAYIALTSAYLFCTTGLYVSYLIFENANEGQ